MILGMIPMALGVGEGGEQKRASRARGHRWAYSSRRRATLIFVPVVYRLMRSNRPEQAFYPEAAQTAGRRMTGPAGKDRHDGQIGNS